MFTPLLVFEKCWQLLWEEPHTDALKQLWTVKAFWAKWPQEMFWVYLKTAQAWAEINNVNITSCFTLKANSIKGVRRHVLQQKHKTHVDRCLTEHFASCNFEWRESASARWPEDISISTYCFLLGFVDVDPEMCSELESALITVTVEVVNIRISFKTRS